MNDLSFEELFGAKGRGNRRITADDLLASVAHMPNPIDRSMMEFRVRIWQSIAGTIPLLFVTGAPGIGKSETGVSMLREYTRILYRLWEAKTDAAKLRDERRTIFDEDTGQITFVRPYQVVSGAVTPITFFSRMYWASYPGEVFYIDDITSLGDRQIRALLQQASDPTNGRWVQYNKKVTIDGLPTLHGFHAFQMRGAIVITHNERRDVDALTRSILSSALLDRSREVEFTWSRKWLFEYIDRQAFTEMKLLPWMRASADPKIDPEKRGLWFEYTDEEAIKLLAEVQTFYRQNNRFVIRHSFRTARDMVFDKYHFPETWKTVIRPLFSTTPFPEGE